MGKFFYLIGIVIAGFSGYLDLEWYFIFISSFIMIIGYNIIRSQQIYELIANNDTKALLTIIPIQLFLYSIVTTPVYLIAKLLN